MFSCIRNVLLYQECSPVSRMFSYIRNVLLYPECSPISGMFSCIRNVLPYQECYCVSGMFPCIQNVLLYQECSPISGLLLCIRNISLYQESTHISGMFSYIRNVILYPECSPISGMFSYICLLENMLRCPCSRWCRGFGFSSMDDHFFMSSSAPPVPDSPVCSRSASPVSYSFASDQRLSAFTPGRYRPGRDEPDPKTWKANFRCALNSLRDVCELQERRRRRGGAAHRVYRMLPGAQPRRRRRGRAGQSARTSSQGDMFSERPRERRPSLIDGAHAAQPRPPAARPASGPPREAEDPEGDTTGNTQTHGETPVCCCSVTRRCLCSLITAVVTFALKMRKVMF